MRQTETLHFRNVKRPGGGGIVKNQFIVTTYWFYGQKVRYHTRFKSFKNNKKKKLIASWND